MSTERLLGLGMDLVEIDRIEDSLHKFGDRFLHRIFHPSEVAYAQGQARPATHLAARFAAKEATIKALGLTDTGVAWTDMEVRRAADGHCTLRLHGAARRQADALGADAIALSLTHDGDYAAAVVVVDRRDRISEERVPR